MQMLGLLAEREDRYTYTGTFIPLEGKSRISEFCVTVA